MRINIYNLLFIKILLLTANKAEKQEGASNGDAVSDMSKLFLFLYLNDHMNTFYQLLLCLGIHR